MRIEPRKGSACGSFVERGKKTAFWHRERSPRSPFCAHQFFQSVVEDSGRGKFFCLSLFLNTCAVLGFIRKNPLVGIELDKPKIQGFPVADADDIAAFQERRGIGSRERLIFGLGLYAGAARADLARPGRKNIKGDLLIYERQKSGTEARVPMTAELRAVIDSDT